MDRLVFFIQMGHNGFSIIDCGSCIHVNRIDLGHFFKKLVAIRPDVEFKLVSFDCKGYISLFVRKYGVYESLVEIKHQKLLLGV